MDSTLLARMTGQSGDRQTLEALGLALAECATPIFQTAASSATGFAITAVFDEFEDGSQSELLASLDVNAVTCKAGIGGWCDTIFLSGNTVFIIALLEGMLGGNLPAAADITPRELSAIECDVSSVIFKRFVESLKSAITDPPTGEVTTEAILTETPEPQDESGSTPSVLLKFTLTAGDLDAPFQVILPQRTLLKTKIAEPTDEQPVEKPEWMEQLSNQVTNSHVTLEANIALADSTLGEIARLQCGDILPFADEGTVRALLKASGKELFWCEFGKAGNRYTVRILEAHAPEQEMMRDLVSG
ncbi:MAG: FliM/FliN family flagellar motor switch protein [Alphaproteobacteria bacterium]|nr:FliM/FliN family flagellar motor switch protein [Alphaproteobacteria bacterium]